MIQLYLVCWKKQDFYRNAIFKFPKLQINIGSIKIYNPGLILKKYTLFEEVERLLLKQDQDEYLFLICKFREKVVVVHSRILQLLKENDELQQLFKERFKLRSLHDEGVIEKFKTPERFLALKIAHSHLLPPKQKLI